MPPFTKPTSEQAFYSGQVSSPPKKDRWPELRWEDQRFVLVRRAGALVPYLGYVVQWPVSGTGGRMLVGYWDAGVTRTFRFEWLHPRDLVPVRIDINEAAKGR